MPKKDPFELPFMKKEEEERQKEKKEEKAQEVVGEATREWEEEKREAELEKYLEKRLKAEESAKKLEPKLKRLRHEIIFEKKEKPDVTETIKKNLEASEKDWEEMEEDLDWRAREEEAKRILGKSGLKKIQEIKEGAEEGVQELTKKKERKIDAGDLLSAAAMGAAVMGGVELLVKRKKKPEAESAEKPAPVVKEKKEVEQSEGKLSLTELDRRVNILWKAMDSILQDASSFKPNPDEKKELKKWVKQKGGQEDWPLDDRVTAENYKDRLAKYGVVDFIDSAKIEPHNDAYAVVSKQYKRYRDELEDRIRHLKLRQLEKLEEEEGSGVSEKKIEVSKKQSKIKPEKTVTEKEALPIEGAGEGVSGLKESEKTIEEMEEDTAERGKKKIEKEIETDPKNLIKGAKNIKDLQKIIKETEKIDNKFINILDRVWKRQIPTDAITNKLGLRKKVEELMEYRLMTEKQMFQREGGKKYIAVDEEGGRHWIPVGETLYSMGIGNIKKEK